MSVARIAGRYAKSLMDLSIEQNKLEVIKDDMHSFAKATENRDLALMLKSPIINTGKKRDILHTLFKGKFDDLTISFFDIVLNKGREAVLADIATAFSDQYRESKGITAVKVTTATKLSEAGLASIKAKLEASSETSKTVEIETAIDPDIIGGFVIEFGDKLYDASIAHRLHSLKKEFAKK